MEDLLGNQNENKKYHSEEGKLKKGGLPILTSTVCTRIYLSIINKTSNATHYNNVRHDGK